MATQTAPKNVIGRDKLIKNMWQVLKDDSILFTAERRIGKTTVLNAMAENPLDNYVVVFTDLEKVNSPKGFVESILTGVEKYLCKQKKLTASLRDFMTNLGGTEIAGVITLPAIQAQAWQPLLEDVINEVCNNQQQLQFVFLWDELPYMLQNIHAGEQQLDHNPNSALLILDTLRSLRLQHANLRMIYTGSVGLHHVLSKLRNKQLASQPTNDMAVVNIGPLQHKFAIELIKKLFEQQDIECDDAQVINTLIELTDAVPFYLERLVKTLGLEDQDIDVAMVKRVFGQQLTHSNDIWQMAHFRQRLAIYYPGQLTDANNQALDCAEVAKVLLDHLALSTEPQSINQCFKGVTRQLAINQRSVIIELLHSLAKDHYLTRDEQGLYCFSFSLLKRWWLMAQGLNV